MSPRSEEFMEQARDRLADAQTILKTAHPAVVVSAAYYGMLYAARAALSERGEYAKTHSGTWTLFSQIFVAPGDFDQSSAPWHAAPKTPASRVIRGRSANRRGGSRIRRRRRGVHRRDRAAAR